MNKKNRIKYVDILRAIAIILVIAGHIPYVDFNTDFHKWVYSFHIPLFFFISGISLSFTNYSKTSFKQLLKKRFNRIYSPYLIWGSSAFILSPIFLGVKKSKGVPSTLLISPVGI